MAAIILAEAKYLSPKSVLWASLHGERPRKQTSVEPVRGGIASQTVSHTRAGGIESTQSGLGDGGIG